MRLLLVEVGDIRLTGRLPDEAIPPYAILSHTWGKEEEEVNFRDISHGVGRHKAGYDKIKFCSETAARHGLDYFWVDTCCIDKWNKAELQHAISSMFQWYRRSERCFVYLSDVSNSPEQATWEDEFRKSR